MSGAMRWFDTLMASKKSTVLGLGMCPQTG